jgi:hypothetical protein
MLAEEGLMEESGGQRERLQMKGSRRRTLSGHSFSFERASLEDLDG